MVLPPCAECEAIYQELVDLVEASHRTKPPLDATPQQIVEWFDKREEDEDYKTRVRPALSRVKQRLIEHQRSTGHIVPRPMPPGDLFSPN